jgi:hypothetical protein
MQRFQFPLEQALRWRTTRLDVENAKLARLQQEKDRAKQLCITLRETARQEVAGFQQGFRNTTGIELGLLAQYRQGVTVRVKRLETFILGCDERIEKQRAFVLKADPEKRLLESLKQQNFEEWSYELNREIENTAGELFLANQRRSTHNESNTETRCGLTRNAPGMPQR